LSDSTAELASASRTRARRPRGRWARSSWLEGSRAVWLPAALVGVVAFGLIVWQLTIPRPYYTGTDSVQIASVVANANPGQSLCVPNLSLPAGTGGVQLALFGQRPSVSAAVSVVVGATTISSRASAPTGGGNLAVITAPIPVRASSPEAVPAKVCVRPLDGPVGVGGMAGLPLGFAPPRLNGTPLEQRIAVWFVPPAGKEHSLLAQAGAIFSRAALFRPRVVGAWTYPVLLFLVLPLAWVAGLLLLARAAAGRALRVRGRQLRPALAIALIAFVNAGSWALITPAFNTPDEPDHFAYGQYLATTGHAPARTPDARLAFSSDQALAMNAVDLYGQASSPVGRPPWLVAQQRAAERFRASVPHPSDNGGGVTPAASPHPPGYYALTALAYELARSGSVFSQLTVMRLVSALFGALVAACAFGILRELLPGQRFAAVAAGLLVAFHPMFSFMAGAVNNDNGINAAAALSLYLLVRALRRGLSWRVALGLGATLAVAPLMKKTGYEIYPAAAVGVLGLLWRNHGRADARAWAALAGGFAFVQLGWSLVLQSIVYPSTIAGQHAAPAAAAVSSSLSLAEHMPGRFLVYLWELFLPKLPFMGDLFPQGWPFLQIYIQRGWASFGWYTFDFPRWVYYVIVLAIGAVGVLAASAAVRNWRAVRKRAFEVAVIALFPVCVLVAVEAAFFNPVGGRVVVAEQGRYIFPAITALAAIAVAGTFGLGRRWQVPLATTLVVAMMALCYASQLLTLGSFFT
jgi:4-amino-4-deoxy-L-arabinose transferase-like glycosyltransferase